MAGHPGVRCGVDARVAENPPGSHGDREEAGHTTSHARTGAVALPCVVCGGPRRYR